MSDLQMLFARNARFAADFAYADLNIMPKLSTVILTCMDARIDPAYFLGLEPGEALVFRNSGGRVTDDVERDIAFTWAVVAQASGSVPNISLAIVHHDDCGLERLANPEFQQMVSQRSGLALSSLRQLAIHDQNSSFRHDMERLRDSSIVPDKLVVSAHLYDPKSGRLNQVIEPTQLREEQSPQ